VAVHDLHGASSKLSAMDVVSVLIAVAMFAFFIVLVYGIERI
jgi:hypothetical protein